MTRRSAFRVALNFDLIQSIRLLHALMESDAEVGVHPLDRHKVEKLEEVFGVELLDDVEGVPELPELEIDHEGEPQTRIGGISRPLIFARGMVKRCRSLWGEERPVRICFAGRLHEDRQQVLRKWTRTQYPDADVEMPSQAAVDRRMEFRKRVKRYAGKVLRGPLRPLRHYVRVPPAERRTTCGEVLFVTSDRGWCHPTKAWDASYFQLLSNAKFVLCPDGRYVWTYRFFEAALCGAIPIVQNECELYDDFRYYSMEAPIDDLEWKRSDARHNFDRCREWLTVSRECLNEEVNRLLQMTSRST